MDVENFDLNSSFSNSCEDLSSNETLSFKLLDTDVVNFDLDISSSNDSEDLSSNETFSESNETFSEPSLGKLRVYYTNADSLLNKIGELEVLIGIVKPDVIVVTELFLNTLNPTNIDKNEYKIKGFVCFTGQVKEHCRGVAIYVREDIKVDYCYPLSDNNFKESVWCEIRVNSKDKLLIGGIYKSPNSNSVNHELLNGLISQAIELKYTSTVILGDFNFPEIDWNTWTVSKMKIIQHFILLSALETIFYISIQIRLQGSERDRTLVVLI